MAQERDHHSVAFFSAYDKSGLVPLARGLAAAGWKLVASGGTARALRRAGLPVTDVAEVTGAPEMLGGRVKTLHPAVHGGILARDTAADRAELAAQQIEPIDLVVCNLYPFAETVARPQVTTAEAVEQIDIGGVALLRAAAKNFGRVTVVCDPADYELVLMEVRDGGQVSDDVREKLAAKAFAHTRDYDTAVAGYLETGATGTNAETRVTDDLPETLSLTLQRAQTLRYGENAHQAAGLYAPGASTGPLGGRLLQGKALSYNNLLDLDAAWRAVASFDEPAVVIVKHLSPCGIATDPWTAAAAFPAALASDPVSAFGGVIAVNVPVEETFVEAVAEAGLFVEAVVAPNFSPQAQVWFGENKQRCRLLALPGVNQAKDAAASRFELRSVRGGYLVQQGDTGDPPETAWRVAGDRPPAEEEWAALRFAWEAVAHVRSNAIVLAHERATVGIGGGLPSRVDAVRLAVAKAGEWAEGAVMASDAFFPFADGVEAAAASGVTAVIQPGGSVRDAEVIAAADRLGLAMVFTGVRHFRH